MAWHPFKIVCKIYGNVKSADRYITLRKKRFNVFKATLVPVAYTYTRYTLPSTCPPYTVAALLQQRFYIWQASALSLPRTLGPFPLPWFSRVRNFLSYALTRASVSICMYQAQHRNVKFASSTMFKSMNKSKQIKKQNRTICRTFTPMQHRGGVYQRI